MEARKRLRQRTTRVQSPPAHRRRMVERLRAAGSPAGEASHAFERALGGFHLAFQPIVSIREHTVLGWEALLRPPPGELATPHAVLGAAEAYNRVHELGRHVRARAARATDALPAPAFLSVNIHPAELFDDELFSASAPLGRVASRIVLEITERPGLDRVPDLEGRIAALRAIGYRIALDDLGSGTACLSSMAEIRPDLVKLDRRLALDVGAEYTRTIVEGLVRIHRRLGIVLVAEGVEHPCERDALAALGCEAFQGYLFARPARSFELPAGVDATIRTVGPAERVAPRVSVGW